MILKFSPLCFSSFTDLLLFLNSGHIKCYLKKKKKNPVGYSPNFIIIYALIRIKRHIRGIYTTMVNSWYLWIYRSSLFSLQLSVSQIFWNVPLLVLKSETRQVQAVE